MKTKSEERQVPLGVLEECGLGCRDRQVLVTLNQRLPRSCPHARTTRGRNLGLEGVCVEPKPGISASVAVFVGPCAKVHVQNRKRYVKSFTDLAAVCALENYATISSGPLLFNNIGNVVGSAVNMDADVRQAGEKCALALR